ncbi:MAG: methyltransferase domain-containing protein [Rhodothermaceae bacterium]
MIKNNFNISGKTNIVTEKGLQRFVDFLENRQYEAYPETPMDYHTQISDHMLDYLLNKYLSSKPAQILDVGCGQGLAIRKFMEAKLDVTGITLNEEDYEICKSQNYNVYQMDQSFLEFEDNSFDIIWARHVLEHSLFPLYTLIEFSRVLKDGGLIYIELPLPGQPTKQETNPNHYSIFSVEVWREVFKKAGLKAIEEKEIKIQHKFDEEIRDEKYQAFFLEQTETINKKIIEETIYLALSKGENFGWGVCSKYLNAEFPKIHARTKIWDFQKDERETNLVEGKVFHALTGLEFFSLSKIRGTENYGYTFFENELNDLSVKNAKNYELVIGGSTWCKEKMLERGITNTDVLLQGIDPEIFYPVEEKKDENMFVIFSGGKFELRKGQDIVLKAVKILQEKYDDIVLMNAWYNMWPASIADMKYSKHIDLYLAGDNWTQIMRSLYEANKMDQSKIFTFELINNRSLRELYAKTDLGLFPNRCEGGTNLVLMEYMACGKPVVASNATGHTDILTNENSLMLNQFSECKIHKEGKLWADWVEPSLDEVIAQIEFAYHNREKIKSIGKKAGEDLKKFTWEETAKSLYGMLK